jgi:hypothetical protein
MSAIAANGIPKLEAGPQKSGGYRQVSHRSQYCVLPFFYFFKPACDTVLRSCSSADSANKTEHATSLRHDRGEPLDRSTYELSIGSR